MNTRNWVKLVAGDAAIMLAVGARFVPWRLYERDPEIRRGMSSRRQN